MVVVTWPSEDPVGRKFVLLVDFDGLGVGSLLTGSIVRDLLGVMQAISPLSSPKVPLNPKP